jgi:hypothetical protein
VVVVVVDWAEASPVPARSADAVTIENSDFLMEVSLCGYVFGTCPRVRENGRTEHGLRVNLNNELTGGQPDGALRDRLASEDT